MPAGPDPSYAELAAENATLRAVIDTVDFLDPQQAYTGQAWWAMWNVYETLITYRHVEIGRAHV